MNNKTDYDFKRLDDTPMNNGNSILTTRNTNNAPTSLSKSFERMGFGGIGSLGGRMGELEKASLRLSQFKGIKTKEEQDRENQAKMKLQQSENAAKIRMQERQIQADREAAERSRQFELSKR